MHPSYSLALIFLSLCVAMLASYTALDLASRIAMLTTFLSRQLWLAGSSFSMGVGVWSMHFIGMLSLSLPITVGYDMTLTACSLLLAIGASYFALYIITRRSLSAISLAGGGLLLGLGIASMHYTGMAAMLMSPGIIYDPTWFAVSVAIAVGASSGALWVARAFVAGGQKGGVWWRLLAAALMSFAITGTHYTGMAAASFLPGAICGAASGINAQWLVTSVTLFTFALLIVSLLLSLYDKRTTLLAGFVSNLNGQIVRMATYDTLTDLPNRRTLSERIEAAIASSTRTRRGFAIFFMDLDGFKAINDTLGHSVGDQVLQAFARRLLYCVRRDDTVARLGGDEFVVLLANVDSVQGAEAMATTILDRMRLGAWDDGQALQVSPSIGIALFPQNGRTVDDLLKNADAAMYEAKRQERGTHRFFEPAMNEAAARALHIQCVLHEALAHGYFALHYQPKFSAASGCLVGAEALLRLHHPTLGTLAPMDFIPIAERSGQIIQIGYWVVREACRQIQVWVDEGLPPIKIAVNLSVRQLAQKDLVAKMLALVHAENAMPQSIMFEITESVAMQDAPKTVNMVREFQEVGFDIAIDDFGTGYSSLAYLQRFRVKQLKIDRFFTNGLDAQGLEGSSIVTAIIALAHSLNMDVVAEGVETNSQLSKLQNLMCDEIQGFLLCKPLPAAEFSTLARGPWASIARPKAVSAVG